MSAVQHVGMIQRRLDYLMTKRARLDMDSLCQKHDLYDDA